MHVVRAPPACLAGDAAQTEFVDVEQAAWAKVPSWPSDIGQLEQAAGVDGPCHRQRTASSSCTLYFKPQDAEPGLTVTFQDGTDLWHRVTLKEPGEVVRYALPLSEKPRPGVRYKFITWEGRESKETQVHSSSSVVACTLTYKPASMFYGNRVEIEAVPYEFAPAPTGCYRKRVRSGATGATSDDTRGLCSEDRLEGNRRRVDGLWQLLLAEAEAGASGGAAPAGATAAAAPGAAARSSAEATAAAAGAPPRVAAPPPGAPAPTPQREARQHFARAPPADGAEAAASGPAEAMLLDGARQPLARRPAADGAGAAASSPATARSAASSACSPSCADMATAALGKMRGQAADGTRLAAVGRELLVGGICHGSHYEEKEALREAQFQQAAPERARASSDAPRMLSETGAGMVPAGHDGGFDWLRRQNGPEDRRRRQEIAATTLAVCAAGGYRLDNKWVALSYVDRMCNNTQLVMAPSEAVESNDPGSLAGETPSASSSSTIWRTYQGQNAVEIAMERARAGLDVAIVNAGSAYSVGGGFLKGGRHALEEAICTRSTLFRSLSVAQQRAKAAGVKPSVHAVPPLGPGGVAWEAHVPEEGAVLSPDVEIFRAGTHDGYRFLREPVRLRAVVTVAMPNSNAQVRDAPVDVPLAPAWLLRQKFAAVLQAAKQARAAVLVVPDVGCGVYGNDPRAVGTALGSVVLARFPGAFREIILVGNPAFCESAWTAGRGKL